jgi:hypothetical protein
VDGAATGGAVVSYPQCYVMWCYVGKSITPGSMRGKLGRSIEKQVQAQLTRAWSARFPTGFRRAIARIHNCLAELPVRMWRAVRSVDIGNGLGLIPTELETAGQVFSFSAVGWRVFMIAVIAIGVSR